MQLGFIGLGIMGRPMALNLMKAGHSLSVYARREAAMTPLIDGGASACSSPREIANVADISFVMVSDTSDVEEVVLGKDGFIQGARRGTVLVDMSTIAPVNTRSVAAKLAGAGVDMLDAPVSGGEIGAINGSLAIMVGGKPQIFERVRPLFEILGKNIVHVGDHGAGQVAKACNQVVVALTIEAVGEAMLFAQKNGVDAARVREALMGGFAASRILEVHGKRMLDDDFRPGFKLKLHQKDMRIVMETAHALGLAMPGAALVTQQMNALIGSGDGELDSSAVIKALRRTSGSPPDR